uniref:LAM_G_DOMAIN domain-containing protein n=1 Tax=Syphacia muris TaxID=451379 RepID=A0A0N5AVJ3_9BILA
MAVLLPQTHCSSSIISDFTLRHINSSVVFAPIQWLPSKERSKVISLTYSVLTNSSFGNILRLSIEYADLKEHLLEVNVYMEQNFEERLVKLHAPDFKPYHDVTLEVFHGIEQTRMFTGIITINVDKKLLNYSYVMKMGFSKEILLRETAPKTLYNDNRTLNIRIRLGTFGLLIILQAIFLDSLVIEVMLMLTLLKCAVARALLVTDEQSSIVGCVGIGALHLSEIVVRPTTLQTVNGISRGCFFNLLNRYCRLLSWSHQQSVIDNLSNGTDHNFTCHGAILSLHLDKEDYIAYDLDGLMSPKTIKFSFLTTSTTGLVMSIDTIGNEAKLQLVLNDSAIYLVFGTQKQFITKLKLDGKKFIPVVVRLSESYVSVDGTKSLIGFRRKLGHRKIIYFGGDKSNPGISGCITSILVDFYDVIKAYERGLSRTFTNRKLYMCPSDKLDSTDFHLFKKQNEETEYRQARITGLLIIVILILVIVLINVITPEILKRCSRQRSSGATNCVDADYELPEETRNGDFTKQHEVIHRSLRKQNVKFFMLEELGIFDSEIALTSNVTGNP